uniref:Ribosomal protein S3 n=1 Tax=Gelidium gabrielsonii TaxID=2483892 RepID=A0A3G2QWU5_9FLOR|nr:ribosomal protein S3 [Gelidium gabrielsonii]AYO27588.1 ribosomal protein S3 [Gelidium gabrielsonii]
MAQKTNPTGLRLGINQVWDSTVQNYGKNHKVYTDFLKKRFLFNHFFKQHSEFRDIGLFSQNYLTLKYASNCIDFTYNAKILQIDSNLFKISTKKIQLILKNINVVESNVKLFYTSKSVFTSNLLAIYGVYLFKQNITLKKIITNLTLFLKNQLEVKKIIYLKNAPRELKLIGFKVRISGRFENTRNRMAKTYEQSVGSISMVCLKNIIEFHNQTIYTKLGTCSLQIWLVYEN